MSHTESKMTFFRQSGWMVIANTTCGVFMAAVHPCVSALLPKAEYSIFLTLLRFFTILAIPAAGLQTVLAQQGAAALHEHSERNLAATARGILWGTFVLWLLMALALGVFQTRLVEAMKITNPASLWVTLLLVLAALWLPVVQGLLQGLQNFLWLGWAMILNGAGRVGAIVLVVWAFHGYAAGAMTGAFLGVGGAFVTALIPCLKLLRVQGGVFAWKDWLKEVVPLTLGVGSVLFVMNADMLVVQSYFPRGSAVYYGAAATIGLALVTFTTPMAAVMFPKIVRSAARSEKSNALMLALGGTALLGGFGALLCTAFPELPLRIMYVKDRSYLKSAELVPWFMWSMVPVTVANVLISNLMARKRFQVVPWLMMIALGYGFALLNYAKGLPAATPPFTAFRHIIQILGGFSLLLLAASLFFTWRDAKTASASQNAAR